MVQARPNTMAKVGKIVLIIVAVLLFVLSLLTGNWIIFIAMLLAAGGAYWVSMYTDVEYEYLYVDKEISVDKVYNKSRRKKVGTYSMERVEIFAPIKSYHLDNFGKRDAKPVDYSIGYEDKPDRRYVMYYEGGQVYYFSPNEEMVKMMKSQNPKKVYSD